MCRRSALPALPLTAGRARGVQARHLRLRPSFTAGTLTRITVQ